MNIKKLICGGFVAMATMVVAAKPEVTDVVAKQRYSWNGLVDITCNVSGIDETTNGLKFAVSAVMPDAGRARNVSQFWIVKNGVSGNGNHGTMHGVMLTTDCYGNENGACHFDGSSLSVANSITLESVTGASTFSVWIQVDKKDIVWLGRIRAE